MKEKKITIDEILFIFLLVFTPIAHGAVEIWSVTLLHLIVIFIVTLRIFRLVNKECIRIYFNWFDWLLVLFLFLSMISIYFSSYPYASRIFIYQLISYLIIYYYVFYLTLGNRIKLYRLIAILVIFGSIYATAALTVIGGHLLGFKVISSGYHDISLFFANRNHFAGYLEMILMLSVAFFMIHRGMKRVLIQILAVYIGIAILFSMSRGGIIAMLSGFTFLAITLVINKVQRRNAWFLFTFLLLIIVIMSALNIEPVLERLGSLENPQLAGKGRLEYWQGTLRLIKDNLWFGAGLGTFIYLFPRYQGEYCANVIVSHAHNDYLEFMAETGVIGFILLSVLILSFLTNTVKRLINLENKELQIIGFCSLAGCISLIIHSFFEFNFHIPSNVVLFIFCAAITRSISVTEKHIKYFSFNIKPVRKIKFLIYSLLIIGMIAWSYFISLPYFGEKYYRISSEYQKAKKYDLAVNSLNKSISIDKGNSEYIAAMGDLMIARSLSDRDSRNEKKFLLAALNYYDNAIHLLPAQSYYYTKKFICLKRLKRYDEAVASLKGAIYYSPTRPFNYYYLGDFYLENNMVKEACKEFKRYFQLTKRDFTLTLEKIARVNDHYDSLKLVLPDDITLKKHFARYLLAKGKYTEAITELEQIYSLEPTVENALHHLHSLCNINENHRALIKGEEYLSIYNDDVRLQKQIAIIYNKLNMMNQAMEIYNSILTKDPYPAATYIEYAHLYAGKNDYKAGIEILTKGIDYNPNNAGLYYLLALYSMKNNQPESGIDYLKRSVFIEPFNINYRFRLAQEYKNQGLYPQAVEQWNNCLSIKPRHNKTVQALNELYNELGMINPGYNQANYNHVFSKN